MSKSTNSVAHVMPEKGWTTDGLSYQLAIALNRANNLIVGKMLTLVESLGLPNVSNTSNGLSREDAVKDLAKQLITESLRTVGGDLDWFVASVGYKGISPDDKESVTTGYNQSLREFTSRGTAE